jgi:hypothetical protein
MSPNSVSASSWRLYPVPAQENPGTGCRIRWCNFAWAGIAVAVDSWPYATPLNINNCRFRYGGVGVVACPTGSVFGFRGRSPKLPQTWGESSPFGEAS